jgi:mono/diheme cytochrome c family protein
MPSSTHLIIITALSLLLGGCGGASDFKPTAGMSAVDIYASACEVCHGANGAGKFGFLFKIAGSESDLEEMANAIQQGGTIMPSYPNLSEPERLMMAAYIKSL